MVNKSIWLAAAAALCLVSGLGGAAAQDWKADTSFASPGHSLNSARESLAAGYYSGAVADLSTLVRRVPEDAEVYFLLGAAHWGNGNKEEARRALARALTLDPSLASRLGDYPVGPGSAGRISLAGPAGAPASAPAAPQPAPSARGEAWMEDTSFLTPGHAYKSGLEELQAGNFSAAANWFRDVVRTRPDSAEAWFQLGAAARAAGQATDAEAALQRARTLDPTLAARIDALPSAAPPARPGAAAPAPIGSAAYFLHYARYQLASGDGPGAANYARQALQVEPGNAEAKLLLSQALLAGPAKAKTCQQQWSSCWVTARDFSDKNMCTQRRLACEAGQR